MDTYGTGQLGNTCDRQLDFLTSGHNQVAKLVDNNNDVWHKAVAVLRIELAVDEFLVVFLDVTHLLTQRVERANHLCDISDDGFCFVVRHFGQEMLLDARIDAEFYLLRVDEHNLQLGRVFLI